MSDYKLKEFQSILKYLPAMGLSITTVAKKLNISASALYNYRNGLAPKAEKYSYILSSIFSYYPEEMNKIYVLLQYEKELAKGE